MYDEYEDYEEEKDKVLVVIKCKGKRCHTSFKRESVTMFDGFSCPSCGFDEYTRIELPFPKKRKDAQEFITKYNEDYE